MSRNRFARLVPFTAARFTLELLAFSGVIVAVVLFVTVLHVVAT